MAKIVKLENDWYGPQDGDGIALISRNEQSQMVLHEIVQFMADL